MDQEAQKLARDQLKDASGRQIGPYVLMSLIGIGGMAAVYKVRDERSGEMVALKLLPPGFTEDQYRLRRFTREAKALKRLSHKNIARYFEAGESDGQHYIAMELVEGQTVEELIRKERLTQDQILRIAIQVVDALASAHAQKIVHRDLKPSNLIIGESGEVKMLDFGLAKALASSGLSSTGDFSLESLTRTGTVLGTVDYMSPEQIRAGEVDHRSDLFAVGVLIYQMATGHVPFHGKSYGDTIRKILDEPPNRITRVNDEPTLAGLDEVVMTCLQKNPSDRYQSAEALLRDLKVAAGEPPDLVEGTSGLWEKGKKKHWVIAAGVLLALLVLWMLVSG
jgi:serine/threonine protein kinase